MSTIPKEEELKIYFENNFDIYGDSQGDVVQAFTFSEFKKAIKHFMSYQLATDGREELEKENARLNELVRTSAKEFNESVTTLNGIFESKITALQSSLKEKEKEISELRKEVDKNYGMIWKAFYLSVCDLHKEEQDKYWEGFLRANNL